MKKLLIISMAILLSSCVTQHRCSDKFPPAESINVKDSTIITHEIRYYDSIIYQVVKIPEYIKKDSVVIRYTDGVASTDKLYLIGHYSQATAWLNGKTLQGELKEGGWIEVETKLRLKDQIIKELRSKTSDTVKIVKEKYIPKFIKILAWIGGVCLSLLLLYIIAVVLVKYMKFNIKPLG